jgi:hypothetical protein
MFPGRMYRKSRSENKILLESVSIFRRNGRGNMMYMFPRKGKSIPCVALFPGDGQWNKVFPSRVPGGEER